MIHRDDCQLPDHQADVLIERGFDRWMDALNFDADAKADVYKLYVFQDEPMLWHHFLTMIVKFTWMN